MNKVKTVLLSLALLIGVVAFVPSYVSASPAGEIQTGVNQAGGTGEPTLGARIQTIVNMLLFLLGAIAVIMIVIGGIRYTTSNGDSGNIKSAKDTILYSAVGLVVAILAYAIVNFVISVFITV